MDKLSKIIKKLEENKDRLLTGWVFHGSEYNGHYLVNKTFLVVAGILNGEPKAFRVPGSVTHDPSGDYIIYTDSTVRITEGERTGLLIDISKVNEYEQIKRVGLAKHLKKGRAAHTISEDREGDMIFLDCLYYLSNEAGICQGLQPPVMFLAVTDQQDRHVKTRRHIKEKSPGVAGSIPHKLIYPYADYYGHGVCTAYGGEEVSPVWIPESTLEEQVNPCVRVNLIDYMKDF